MNDQHDNEQADRAIRDQYLRPSRYEDPLPHPAGLAGYQRQMKRQLKLIDHRDEERRVFIPAGSQRLCRFCWRPVYLAYGGSGDSKDPGNCYYDLVYREYADTTACDARGDGAVLSTLPHEPAPVQDVGLGKLIELAAQSISVPGTFRDTDETYDLGIVRLITEAAGLTTHDEDYVYAAIIRAAYETRGTEFQRAAYRYGAMEPWGRYWHAHRPTRQVPGPIGSTKDADRRMQAWARAGRPSHVFSGQAGEDLCRVCAGGRDGIQHEKE